MHLTSVFVRVLKEDPVRVNKSYGGEWDGKKEKKERGRRMIWKEILQTHCIRPRRCGPRSRYLRHTATGPGCRYTPQTHWPHMWSGSSHTNTQRCPELLHTQRNRGLQLIRYVDRNHVFVHWHLCFCHLHITEVKAWHVQVETFQLKSHQPASESWFSQRHLAEEKENLAAEKLKKDCTNMRDLWIVCSPAKPMIPAE